MRKQVDTILERLLIGIITVMLLAVIWQVLSRYLLGTPSTLTDEIASYALIWLGLFGAAYATGKELHLAIDLLPERILRKAPIFFISAIPLSILIFAVAVMIIGGSHLCWLTFLLKQKSAALEIPLTYVYIAIPISGAIITYYSIDNFIKEINSVKKSGNGSY
ncbi:MAG: TRAP transporter small permease [Saonia sp.]